MPTTATIQKHKIPCQVCPLNRQPHTKQYNEPRKFSKNPPHIKWSKIAKKRGICLCWLGSDYVYSYLAYRACEYLPASFALVYCYPPWSKSSQRAFEEYFAKPWPAAVLFGVRYALISFVRCWGFCSDVFYWKYIVGDENFAKLDMTCFIKNFNEDFYWEKIETYLEFWI